MWAYSLWIQRLDEEGSNKSETKLTTKLGRVAKLSTVLVYLPNESSGFNKDFMSKKLGVLIQG